MNFFSRHRKVLIEYGTAPAAVLIALAACFVFFRPAQMPWHQFLSYFFGSPLGMALEAIVVVAMLAYQLHHSLHPGAPRHRAYYAAGALAAGIVVDGIYVQRLSQTIYFTSASGASQFFAAALVFYCLYRLVLLAPDRERKWVTIFFAAALSLHLLIGGYGVYKRVAPGFPCHAKTAPDLWYVIVYKNPQQHCAPQ